MCDPLNATACLRESLISAGQSDSFVKPSDELLKHKAVEASAENPLFGGNCVVLYVT